MLGEEKAMKATSRHLLIGSLIAGTVTLFTALGMAADTAADTRHSGRATVYKNLHPESLEQLTTPERIKAITTGSFAPTEVWRALEHGEKVECLDCIPYVSKLLYDDNAKNREISAWWLRRRIFGVFGPSEVYAQTVATLTDPSATEFRRAYAAEALGEFLSVSGVKFVAKALGSDPSAKVRKSSALALERLNSQGPNGELGLALGDPDEDVRMAALRASARINVFTGLDKLVLLISDPSARVRKRAAENLGVMRASDAVVGLAALTSPDTEKDAQVRAAAVASLGRIADTQSKPAVENALKDPNQFVRDAARISLRRL